MKRNLIQLATVAALAAGMAIAQAPAGAQAPAAGTQASRTTHRPFRAAVRQRMMQALNLTDAQKQQAKAIFQQARATNQPIRQQLQQNRQAMRQAIKSDDEATIQQLSKTEGALTSQMIANRNVAAAQFYKLLTPEQRAKADQMHQNMRQRFEQRRARPNNG